MSLKEETSPLIDESARIIDSVVGAGSHVGIGCILRDGVRVGENCRIGDYVLVEGEVEISDGVEIESYSHIRGPVTMGMHVRVGSHSCVGGPHEGMIEIQMSATIGAHATIMSPVRVGEFAIVEAGAVVMKNVPSNAVVAGNPAKIVRYHQAASGPTLSGYPREAEGITTTSIPGVNIFHMPVFEDLRGNLSVGEIGKHIPFEVKRYFLTFEVESEQARGEHAHRTLHGRVHILADNGQVREEFILDRPNVGLHLPPMIWGVQYRFSPGAVLLVLCSDLYDPGDYIRDYSSFLAERRLATKAHE
jgi:UDP-2-acetamido-3-amino-2,3-dideoxy-glucuronate N-acetyltransferase